jgi:hypothetical protein
MSAGPVIIGAASKSSILRKLIMVSKDPKIF